MVGELPAVAAADVDAAGAGGDGGLLVLPPGGHTVGEQHGVVRERDAPRLLEPDLGPASPLGVLLPDRLDRGVRGDDVRLRKDQNGVVQQRIAIERGVVGPQLPLDVEQPVEQLHSLAPAGGHRAVRGHRANIIVGGAPQPSVAARP